MRGILLLIGASIVCGCLCAEARDWTSTDGRLFEGEFIIVLGDKAVIRKPNGDEVKIPLTQFSKDDLTFMELENPPTLKLDVSKHSDQHFWPQKMKTYNPQELPETTDYVFTTKIQQTSAGSYNHKLNVECFIIGGERDGDNYILFDRMKGSFVPAEQEDKSYQFSGRKVRMFDYEDFDGNGRRGQVYTSFLIIVTDSRGEIIAQKSPKDWMYDIAEPLRKLSLNAHFDKTGTRVHVPRPKYPRKMW